MDLTEVRRKAEIAILEHDAEVYARRAARQHGTIGGEQSEVWLRETNAKLIALGETPRWPLGPDEHLGLEFLAR